MRDAWRVVTHAGQSAGQSAMLTAWDKVCDATLALPDFESGAALATVRERTRQGELVCPTCRQLLWIHAGTVLIPHFAHRRLSNCPSGFVSEAVLGARRLLYRFFQARIESGKLRAGIVLEPVIAGLPKNVRVDLLLRRAEKPAVSVVLLERGLKPDLRAQLGDCLQTKGGVFRPVFLRTRLQRPEDEPTLFLLDTTQRAFRLCSPYDLWPPQRWLEPGTLHFIDPVAAEWTTLRGVSLAHDPQVFRAKQVRVSKLDQLLWSEGHVEWVHPGEAEALKRHREAAEARQRREAEQRRKAEQKRQADARRNDEKQRQARQTVQPVAPPARFVPTPPEPKPACIAPVLVDPPRKDPDPLPAWLTGGLVCVGCGQRTTAWQNAAPDKDQCVCRACFAAGVRLR